ncbi:MAG: acyltransferase [Clostridium sp.]|uniref:acyltransferase n=1 Tax=Clostridium sp. TaxID=1506 RepID=UPI00290E213D|nr:acyltransferase [Clostridium sp.]MDU5109604.1 acyltransferase [Clostridium sp.]
MRINLINYYWIFLFIGAIIFIVSKKSKVTNVEVNEYLDKQSTDCLKGLSVLIVIFHHIALFSSKHNTYYNIFRNAGFLAVSIFLFVAGYGLMVQYLKKENYLKGFWRKILNLYLVFFVSNIVVTAINNLFLNTRYGIRDVLISSISFRFANERELWFVAVMIFMYFSFYIAFKFFKGKTGIVFIIISTIVYIILCKKFNRGSWWYNTSICFTIGIIFAIYKDRIYEMYQKRYTIKLIILLAFFGICMFLLHKKYWDIQYITPIVFITLITLLLLKFKLNSKVITFINNISFEMYLVHLIVLKVAFKEQSVRSSIYVVLLFPIMILLALIVQYICKYIKKIFRLV